MPDGKYFTDCPFPTIIDPIAVMNAENFSQVWALDFGECFVPKVWLINEKAKCLKNLVFEVSPIFGIELGFKIST